MDTRRTLRQLIDDRSFLPNTAENIFLFFVALGREQDERVQRSAWGWLNFNMTYFPHMALLVNLFPPFLMTHFPLSKKHSTEDVRHLTELLQQAQTGCSRWLDQLKRACTLHAIFSYHEQLLRITADRSAAKN